MTAAVVDESRDHRVRVVLYFDELYDLTISEMVRNKSAPPSLAPWTMESVYVVLCRCFDSYARHDIFHIFLSTSPSLFRSSPPQAIGRASRSRNAQVDTFQAPFVELPLDTWRDRVLIREGLHGLEDVCQLEFMVRFGRPL